MISALLIATLLSAEPNYSVQPQAVPRDGLQFLREAFARKPDVNVGEWATYRLGVPGRKAKFWRIAAVGADKDARGKDAMWFEIEAGEHPEFRAPLVQMKMLLSKEHGFDMKGMTRLIVAVGAAKPQEVTQTAIDEAAKTEPYAEPPEKKTLKANDPSVAPKMKTGAPTRIMTLAGTVTAVPIEFSIRNTVFKRIWMSDQVPIIHIAKLELPGIDYSVEVRDFGIDARPRMLMPKADEPKIQIGDLDKYLSPLDTPEDTNEPPEEAP